MATLDKSLARPNTLNEDIFVDRGRVRIAEAKSNINSEEALATKTDGDSNTRSWEDTVWATRRRVDTHTAGT